MTTATKDNFLIGADPELFLMKGKDFISAETREGPLIPGTKDKPFKVKDGAIQVDGVAAEFNINPAKNFEEFFGNTKSVLADMRKIIHDKDSSIQLAATPVAKFKKSYFEMLPEKTLELGCEPDYDAYTEKANERPSTDLPMRTASGHVHIGWCKDANPLSTGHMMDCILVVKELDKYLHFASLDWDQDKVRRRLYGKIGAFRPKPYGLEYRVLSNVWLKKTETVRAVYNITKAVIRSIDSGTHDMNADPSKDSYGETNTDKVMSCLAGHVEW